MNREHRKIKNLTCEGTRIVDKYISISSLLVHHYLNERLNVEISILVTGEANTIVGHRQLMISSSFTVAQNDETLKTVHFYMLWFQCNFLIMNSHLKCFCLPSTSLQEKGCPAKQIQIMQQKTTAPCELQHCSSNLHISEFDQLNHVQVKY